MPAMAHVQHVVLFEGRNFAYKGEDVISWTLVLGRTLVLALKDESGIGLFLLEKPLLKKKRTMLPQSGGEMIALQHLFIIPFF